MISLVYFYSIINVFTCIYLKMVMHKMSEKCCFGDKGSIFFYLKTSTPTIDCKRRYKYIKTLQTRSFNAYCRKLQFCTCIFYNKIFWIMKRMVKKFQLFEITYTDFKYVSCPLLIFSLKFKKTHDNLEDTW